MPSSGHPRLKAIGPALALCGTLAFTRWATGAELTASPKAELAEVEVAGPFRTDIFRKGATLFSNRAYVLQTPPESLDGQRFVRNSIDQTWFRCAKSGLATLLTPDPAHPRAASLYWALEQQGFVRVQTPETFQLFGDAPYDKVRIYRKQLTEGEEFRFGKYVVLVGLERVTKWQPRSNPWAENDGALLYNGIRLPRDWPPASVDPQLEEPMPVPYLDHPPKVIPIDVGRQLFVDNFLIESTDLTRAFHKAQKFEGNPILWPQTPLELNAPHNALAGPKSGGIWWDPEAQEYKMWYEAGWLHTVCLATSQDGLRWNRPNLDVEPGSNRVLDASIKPDSWTVFPDYNGNDSAARWKMFLRSPGGALLPGISMVSADGIHWTNRVKTGVTGDRSTMFYNPFRSKWVYSLRSSDRGRSRHYLECDDFLKGAKWLDWRSTFGPRTPVFWAGADKLDPPDPEVGDKAQLYNLDAVAYESILLGIFEIHRGPANGVCMTERLPKITELNLAYSRDGFHWARPDREAFIPATRRDTWDRGYVQSVGGLCTVVGDKLWFYYIGFQGNLSRTNRTTIDNGAYDRGSTGVAFVRRDGFVSLDASSDGGTIVTRPVCFTGEHLFINVECPKGELKAEVLAENGKPIEPFLLSKCIPVSIDSTRVRVSWQGQPTLAALKDRPVRFRFSLKNGSLFSFWVSPAESGESNGYVAAGGPEFDGYRDSVRPTRNTHTPPKAR